MPSHKITLMFRAGVNTGNASNNATANALQGWSESWYRTTNETDTAALAIARQMVSWRKLMLTRGWMIYAARVNPFPFARTGGKANIPPADGTGTYSPVGSVDEQPYDALIVNCASASGRQRAFLMRGVGSDVVSPGAVYLAPGDFQNAFNQWNTFMLANCGMKITTATGRRTIQAVVTNPATIAGSSPFTPTIQLGANYLEFTPGITLRIGGVQGMSGIAGQWIADAVWMTGTTQNIQLKPKRGTQVFGTYSGSGYIYTLTPSTEGLASLSPGYGTSRRTGSPPLRPRGRRSRRRS